MRLDFGDPFILWKSLVCTGGTPHAEVTQWVPGLKKLSSFQCFLDFSLLFEPSLDDVGQLLLLHILGLPAVTSSFSVGRGGGGV